MGQHHEREAARVFVSEVATVGPRDKSTGPGGAGVLVLTLGAQEGPQHRDRGEEEVAAAQATAGAVTGEDGLWGLIQGLICGDTGDRAFSQVALGWALSKVPGLGDGAGTGLRDPQFFGSLIGSRVG